MAKRKPNRKNGSSRRRTSDGPSTASLKRLPQQGDVWMADCRQLPMYIEGEHGQPERPWIILVVSFGQQLILAQQVTEQKPSPKELWDTLAQAMQKPLMGDKQRPVELQIRAHLGWEELHPALQELGIESVTKEELEPIASIVEHLAESIGGEQPSSLMDIPGVSVDQVGRFYDAAAEFYKQAPWSRLRYENAVRIDCPEIEGGPWFAVLMGQSGLMKGVALYDDLAILKRLWTEELSDKENAELTVATTVAFGDSNDIAPAELEAAQEHGWRVARPDAYPSIFHKDQGLSMRPPTAGELDLAEASLRALPEFVKRRRQDDVTPESLTISTAAGERNLKLAWEQPD
ncbi:MAG TPA: hypothetical protein VE999_05560 [Gemmataceae bacterium]|nr:hypothetical protein [Gemmataceae bacterium]